ncbi:hypothetical protein MHYP_G00169650 [Metynnis hypsauchen]
MWCDESRFTQCRVMGTLGWKAPCLKRQSGSESRCVVYESTACLVLFRSSCWSSSGGDKGRREEEKYQQVTGCEC